MGNATTTLTDADPDNQTPTQPKVRNQSSAADQNPMKAAHPSACIKIY